MDTPFGRWLLYLDNPCIAVASLYVKGPDGGWLQPQALDRTLAPADMPTRFVAFGPPPAAGERTLYLRMGPLSFLLFKTEVLQ